MSTTQEKIAVMQAHADGKAIEMWAPGAGRWHSSLTPSWNWETWQYRVAVDPLDVALKIYTKGKYPQYSSAGVDLTILSWAPTTREDIKKGLAAVISAVKSGELS